MIDFDGSLVTCHSEKQGAAPTFKHGFGYHPLLVWLDNANEALAGMLRPGNAGSNDAADHIRLTDEAISQIPDADLHGQPILVRCDGAGAAKEWLASCAGTATNMDLTCGSWSGSRHQPGQGRDRDAAESVWTWARSVGAAAPRP